MRDERGPRKRAGSFAVSGEWLAVNCLRLADR